MVEEVSRFVKNFNIGIYSDTMNVINVKLCTFDGIELYLFIAVSVTLTVFQGQSNVEQF